MHDIGEARGPHTTFRMHDIGEARGPRTTFRMHDIGEAQARHRDLAYIESEKLATYKLPRAFSILFTYLMSFVNFPNFQDNRQKCIRKCV